MKRSISRMPYAPRGATGIEEDEEKKMTGECFTL
jgi:hypothetical protein